jgi:5-methylcytosine-specific restriction endonuclease McrA
MIQYVSPTERLRPRHYYRAIQPSLWLETTCGTCHKPTAVARRQGPVSCEGCHREAIRRERGGAVRFWENMKARARLHPGRPSICRLQAVLDGRWALYGGLCWVCRGLATEWDHVKPLRAGGAPLLGANLRPICSPCNVTKSGAWPWPQ